MLFKNTAASYGLIAKIFHWSMALLILGLLSIGFAMESMDVSPDKFRLYWWHKSFGILVLFLLAGRFTWRACNMKLDALDTHKPWERRLAHFTHYALYLLAFLLPLTGWLMSSAGDFPAGFFGLFELPDLTAKNESLFVLFRNGHEILAFIIFGLIGLHVAGALKHHFIDRDSTLHRMTWARPDFKKGLAFVLFVFPFLLAPAILIVRDAQKAAPAGLQERKSEPVNNLIAVRPITPAWIIETKEKVITFEARQYGEIFSGTFDIADAQIFFDPADLQESRVSVEIDITSLATGSEDRDRQGKGPDRFDAARFPKAVFSADRFEKTGDGDYVAYGSLKIRDISKPLSLPFSLEMQSDTARMQATLSLNRLDFAIGRGSWAKTDIIGNDILVKIGLTASKRG